jgi:HK97 gp10 family phage protein
MPETSFEIKGGAELEKRLKELPDKVAVNVMVGATFAGAKVILAAARKRVPIFDKEKGHSPHEPGYLLANLKASRTRSRDRNTVGAKVGITFDAFYGHFIEFGTARSKAFPFMRPAADEAREEAVSALTTYAGRRIEQEAAKK